MKETAAVFRWLSTAIRKGWLNHRPVQMHDGPNRHQRRVLKRTGK